MQCSCSQVQPIRVEVAPGQVEICQVYEMEELLSVASTRIATMYHNNPVSSLFSGLVQCTELFSEALRIATMYHNPVSSLSRGYCSAQNHSVRLFCALPPCVASTQSAHRALLS